MRILVVGSGGREHALAWSIAASSLTDALFAAPGNPGIAEEAECLPIAATDSGAIRALVRERRIDLVVIGPEGPLVEGLADQLAEDGVAVFGPGRSAARLEGSKAFTKSICDSRQIPTAAWKSFDALEPALAHLDAIGAPIVVKADGLAAGKGVIMAETRAEAEEAVRAMLDGGRFGAAGASVVIESWLGGEEASFFALVDGETALPLASAQDHKRVGDGDSGPNTGGMGAYSPAPVVTPEVAGRIMDRIIEPTVAEMAARGCPFKGVLYAGVMIEEGIPRLLEYNVRFGDPECQALMMRLKSDLVPALLATHHGGLRHFDLRWHEDPAMTVVLASKGYPGSVRSGGAIGGIAKADAMEGVKVFHAGTALEQGQLVAAGGRALNVTARGSTLAEARDRAYRAVETIDFPDGFCRSDIGFRAIPASRP